VKNFILVPQIALRRIYGVGPNIAQRICARLLVHDRCRVKDLTPNQIIDLASFLQSPSTAPRLPIVPLASPSFKPPPLGTPVSALRQPTPAAVENNRSAGKKKWHEDPLSSLKIEAELKTEIRENIAHQRMIGSYVGRRHAMGLPVRGQNTQTNAKTARKLNKIDRKL
jgi:small subunit ribosomal protein S13